MEFDHATTARANTTMSHPPHLQDWLDDQIASLRDAVETRPEVDEVDADEPAEARSNGASSPLPLEAPPVPEEPEPEPDEPLPAAEEERAPEPVADEPVEPVEAVPAAVPARPLTHQGRSSRRRRWRRAIWRTRSFVRKRLFGLVLYGTAFVIAIAVAWLVASRA